MNRTPQALYNQAVAALGNDEFLPVPRCCNRYEVNRQGTVRNAKTKKIIKRHKTPGGKIWYWLLHTADRKKKSRRFLASILSEVFGIRNKNRQSPQPVVLTKGNRRIWFESFASAANFLATQYFYQPGTFTARMKKRKPVIEDWQVTYLLDDNNDYAKSLNLEANRQKRVWGSL